MAVTSSVQGNSPSGMWAMINQLQLLILLLITGAYLPKDIRDYITGMEFSMFSFSFLPFESIWFIDYNIGWLNFEQGDEQMTDTGMQSGSSLINNFSFLFLLGPMVGVHVLIGLLYCCIRSSNPNRFKFLKWLITKLFHMFTFTIYLRYIIEAFQFLLMSTCSEFFEDKKSVNFTQFVSFYIACVMAIF